MNTRMYILPVIMTIASLSVLVCAQDCSDLSEASRNGVVSITVESQNAETGAIGVGHGTGFFISAEGYVITADHVLEVESGAKIRTITASIGSFFGDRIPLSVAERKIGGKDIALLEYDGANGRFTALGLGNPKEVKIGRRLCSFGFAGNDLIDYHLSLGAYTGRKESHWITDMTSNHGESGSPVFDADTRRVVAIKKGALQMNGVTVQGANVLVPLNFAQEAIRTYTGIDIFKNAPANGAVKSLSIDFETGSNPKDSALEVFATVLLGGSRIGSIPAKVGAGERWSKGSLNSFQFQLDQPLTLDNCGDLKIVVDKTHRFQWDMRFRVIAALTDGRVIEAVPFTRLYYLGDNNNDDPAIEAVRCG